MKPKQRSRCDKLSHREQQILSSVSRRKGATTREVVSDIPDQPSYSSIRKIMEIMVEKGLLSFHRDGLKYVYKPVIKIAQARSSVLIRLVKSLFENSPVAAVATILQSRELKISGKELEAIKELIAEKAALNKKAE